MENSEEANAAGGMRRILALAEMPSQQVFVFTLHNTFIMHAFLQPGGAKNTLTAPPNSHLTTSGRSTHCDSEERHHDGSRRAGLDKSSGSQREAFGIRRGQSKASLGSHLVEYGTALARLGEPEGMEAINRKYTQREAESRSRSRSAKAY